MKNIKIFGLLLAFCGMAGVVACDGDKEKNNAGEFSASVNFANGSETWNATECYGGNEDEFTGFIFYKYPGEDAAAYPAVEGVVYSSGTTDFSDDDTYVEYYSSNYNNRIVSINDVNWGDWRAASGTVKITSSDKYQISGNMDLMMLDFYDYWVNDNDTPEVKILKVTFSNIPRDGVSTNVTRALESPDRKYVFRNKMPVRF